MLSRQAIKEYQKIMEFFKDNQTIKNSQIAPILSGSVAIVLLSKIIFSSLDFDKFKWAMCSVVLIFMVSVILYFLLRRLEQDKDKYLISSIGKIVEDVFKHYGQKVADRNADRASANDMNLIMQTIVNLVGKMKNLALKNYTGELKNEDSKD